MSLFENINNDDDNGCDDNHYGLNYCYFSIQIIAMVIMLLIKVLPQLLLQLLLLEMMVENNGNKHIRST